MALFPITSKFEGDFVLQLVATDTEHSMDQVAAAAAHHSVGRRVAPRPGHVVRVRRQGQHAPFHRDLKLADSGVLPMECLEFYFEPVQ